MGWFRSWMEENETLLEVEAHFKNVRLVKKFSFGKITSYVFEAKSDDGAVFPVVSRWNKYMFKNAFDELICFKLGAKINAFVLAQILKRNYPPLREEFAHIEQEIGLPDKFKDLEYEIIHEPQSSGHFLKLVLLPNTSA